MEDKRTFSEQLREAVEVCGTSRYALAIQLGISESSLSRFATGKQGLALDTIDKLVHVLGLKLVGTVQRVARRAPRGRKKAGKQPQHGKGKVMMKKKDWIQFAARCAQDAHKDFFSSRRGTWYMEDLDVVVFYNNNPYAKHPEMRDEELAEFRKWLQAESIKELAYATFPEDRYTYAMVLDVSRDREDLVADMMEDITMKVLGRECP